MPEAFGLGTLQRLSALLPSTASTDEKMKVAAMISDSRTMNVLGEMNKKDMKKALNLGPQLLKRCDGVANFCELCARVPVLTLRPKALSRIKQERLASRQELKAVANILSHIGLELDGFFPKQPLLPRGDNESRQVYMVGSENFSFVYDNESGNCRWDVPMHSASGDVRLVLCADQGSPLFSCFQYLAFAGMNVLLIRDELLLACTVVFVLHSPIDRPRDPDPEDQAQTTRTSRESDLVQPCHQTHLGSSCRFRPQ